MSSRALDTGTAFENISIVDPAELVKSLSTLDSNTLQSILMPLAERMAQDPTLAAGFIEHLLEVAVLEGTDLNPILRILVMQHINKIQMDESTIQYAINQLSDNQPALMEFFAGLDETIQKQFCALSIYLQINRTISPSEYFNIAKKLGLPSLPKELWNVLRFGVSNMGHMNTKRPATLEIEG